ncbi:MAG TPA: hypothetical protein VNW96_19245, partial [Mycobacterium sp.]|nr:hypothetical protein [Mycobacterium sp.]
QLAEWVERVLASWGDFGGDLVCSARCRFGYLEGNGEGSDKDPALCRCGRVALERLLDGVPVEVPTAPE